MAIKLIPNRHRKKGVALITALFVTSIATIVAVSISSHQFVEVRRTSNMLEADQAYLYALGLETVAKQLLGKYLANYKYDDPELLFQPYTFPVEGGVVNGKLIDPEGLFNLNNVLNADGKPNTIRIEQLGRLIKLVVARLGVSNVNADDLVNAVVDWVDKDEQVSFPGAEDTDYLIKEPPYRAANRLMASASELFLVNGFTRELLVGRQIDPDTFEPGLLKYVTALPESGTRLNVNTVDELVLQSVSTVFDQKIVADIKDNRPYKTWSDFDQGATMRQLVTALNGTGNQSRRDAFDKDTGNAFDIQSSYHMVSASVSIGSTAITLSSLIYHDTAGNKIITISRAQGTNGI